MPAASSSSGTQSSDDGEQLQPEWKAESRRAAINKYKEAISSLEAAGETHQQALALREVGSIYRSLDEFENSLAYYKQALLLFRKTDDRKNEGETLNDIGHIYLDLGNPQLAMQMCSQALEISRAVASLSGEAQALNNIGEVYYGFGDLQQSIQFFEKSQGICTELNDLQGQALALLNLGYSYSDLGQMQKAFELYNQSLSLWRNAGNRRWEGITLTAIGRLYSRIGESQEALNFFDSAMRLIKGIGDPIEEARILNGMAYIYDGLGEKEKALEHYNQALMLFRSVSYRAGETNTLFDIGTTYYLMGNFEKALEHYQEDLLISKEIYNEREELYALRGIGTVYDAWGKKSLALEYYNRARAFYHTEKDLRGEADTLNLIGRIYEGWQQKSKALEHYTRALALSRKAEDPSGQASTLYNIARLEGDRGNLAEARAHMEEAISVIESLRNKVDSQDLRTSYFASMRQHYESSIDLLMQLHAKRPTEGFNRAAFEANERGRARSMLETLAAARVGIRQKADPALLERERLLRKELEEKRARALANKANADVAAITREIDELSAQYRELSAQIRASSLNSVVSIQPQPLSLEQVQQRVVDDDTLLLEYSLGDKRSYLWAVTKTSIASYEIAGRAEIEALANSIRDALAAPQMNEGEAFEQYRTRLKESETRYWQDATTLSNMLLGPAAAHLTAKQLIIVPDGALQYIPFSALPSPDAHDAEPAPLMLNHEITSQPSASTLATLRDKTAERQPAARAVAIFADPVFEQNDPRLGAGSEPGSLIAQSQSGRTQAHRALRSAGVLGGGQEIPRLFASSDEADAIMDVTTARLSLKATGFQASKAIATSPELSQYQIIHFATHGILDSENSEMSGLVLSLFDGQGQPQDGFLGLNDIYNLDLPAELVVLSACNTGLGKSVKGEGLVGLTRGFIYAGAARVMATLWKVDDDATAELMKHFYQKMLREKKSPATALREAQAALWQQKRWRAPYYWAAFVLQGEYKQEALKETSHTSATRWAIPAVALLALVFIFYTMKKLRQSKSAK